ncbi:hypothetical protein Cfor_02560, partial [Coptotermes formosanus]
KCSCLSANSKATQGGYVAKDTRLLAKRVLLLHYNARPHSAAAALKSLTAWGWDILPHPPHSRTSVGSQK